MTAWLLTLLLATSLFALSMGALSLRHKLGLAPLMLVMGALEGLKGYVLTGSAIDLAGVGTVRLGSVVSYMNALAVVQVLYLRCGLAAARQLAWTLVCVAGALALLNPLAAWLLAQPEVLQPLTVNVQVLASSGRIEAVGNLLLLAGLLISVVLVNTFQSWRLGRWLSLLFAMLIVATVDTVLFLLLAFGPEALGPGLVSSVLGKACMALLLATLAYAYLRSGVSSRESRAMQLPSGGALLAALSFRRRLADMEKQLQTDPLTGAYNRRYLDQTVPELLHLDQLRGLPTSLVLMDIDHFKRVNDEHGHLVGDQALRHVAQTLRQSLRRNDTVLRYGGEEFLLVLPCTGLEEARRLTELVLAHLRDTPMQRSDGLPLSMTASAGVATAPVDGSSLPGLLRCADERLYRAKQEGRNQAVYTSAGSTQHH